jgi:hypothetical protein
MLTQVEVADIESHRGFIDVDRLLVGADLERINQCFGNVENGSDDRI